MIMEVDEQNETRTRSKSLLLHPKLRVLMIKKLNLGGHTFGFTSLRLRHEKCVQFLTNIPKAQQPLEIHIP